MDYEAALQKLQALYVEKIINGKGPNKALIFDVTSSDQFTASGKTEHYLLIGFMADDWQKRKFYTPTQLAQYLSIQKNEAPGKADLLEYLIVHFDDLIALSLDEKEKVAFKSWAEKN